MLIFRLKICVVFWSVSNLFQSDKAKKVKRRIAKGLAVIFLQYIFIRRKIK